MIIEERPFDDEFYSRDFLCYEENDLVDNRDFIPPKRKRKIETIYGSSDEEILAEDHEIIEGETSKAIDNKALDKNNKDAVIDNTNFSTLSAVAIRRYKKFFKLPNRSGANSKQQLLDGIEEHFKSLPIDIPETVAFFMHTVKSKRNKLDYPNEEFVHKKQLRSDM
uniref:Histone deacetylase complex subunit SAP30 Sin3 binding domain-containing protein n=2 Tax=Acrobeloides nanus TaxID=290746 RepID=A0A914BXP6_9BILA